MKDIIYKIRQVLNGTRVIENQLKYIMLCATCAVIHLFFVGLYFWGKVYFLMEFNIASVVFYVLGGIFLAPREKYKAIFILSFCEIELNSFMSSILLGPGYEFMIYTLSLIPGAFYMAHTWPETKKKYRNNLIPPVTTFIIGISYIVVEFLYSATTPTFSNDEIIKIKPIFHYFNIMVSVVILLVFSLLFALEVRYILRLANAENSRLGEIASKDPLTKALNRRSMNEYIAREMAENSDLQFGLILLDIDDFKSVNDTYGHSVGDTVLVEVANILSDSIREGDLLCRWGGEEFLLMVHGTSETYPLIAERIRERVEATVIKTENVSFSVTVTLGVSVYQKGLKLRTLVDMADQKMYFGKNHGKNQVVS